VGCYIWYSEEGTRRGHCPPRPLLAVGAEGLGVGRGCSPPHWGWGLGRGLCPSPENFWTFYLEIALLGAF